MRVEPATSADLDALVDAWVDLAETQRRHGSNLATEANRETIRQVLAHHVVDGSALVAREPGSSDDRVTGFVNFGLESGGLESEADRGIVHNVYVEPAARGEGVGTALVEAAESALADRGASVVAIEAMADNEAARRLYQRLGYQPHRVQLQRVLESDTNSKEGD